MRVLVLLFVALLVLYAQAQHTVTLTWQDTQNPTGTTYSVYRAPGLCSGTPAWNKIATALEEKAYTDSTVQPGNYAYQVTATVNGVESAPSNCAQVAVPAFPPQNLSLQVQ